MATFEGPIHATPKHVHAMAELHYTVVIEPDDGAFSVIVPAFPEISTFGGTQEDALEMARDAIRLSLDYRQDKGLDIPASDDDLTRIERVVIPFPAA